MAGRVVGMQHEAVDVGRAEMEHPRLMVIDPDDCVKMVGGHEGPFVGKAGLPTIVPGYRKTLHDGLLNALDS
jgi:hypothetical protein